MSSRQLEILVQDSIDLALPGASLTYHPGFFSTGHADHYFHALKTALNWQHRPIVLFGRRILQPRLVAWYGEAGVEYGYSGDRFVATGWVSPLDEICRALQSRLGFSFNTVLCNRYRDGQDSMGWHADNEAELGDSPLIASVSFGTARMFHLRPMDRKGSPCKLELQHGSVLLMSGATQKNWQHCLPKVAGIYSERINLTFRQIPAQTV